METRPVRPPTIPIRPSSNMIIVDQIHQASIVERKLKKDNPQLIVSKDQIKKMNTEVLESTGDICQVWDTHPMQGVIVAIDEKVQNDTTLRVGDRIAWRTGMEVGFVFVFDKKKYACLYPHDIIGTYLTDKV